MSVVGLDLGFQTSLVAAPKQGGIEVLINEYSQRKTTSLVSFTAKQRVLGEDAKSTMVTNSKNTIKYFKALIGRQYSDADVQETLSGVFFKHTAMPDGTIGVTVQYLNEPVTLSITQIVAMLLVKLKTSAAKELGGSKVVDVCVSVPVWFNDYQRQELLNATKIAGLNCLKLCNETSAIALAYGIYKQDLPAPGEAPRRVVFVDIGHSQMQICAADYVKGKLTILGTASNTHVGGRKLDLALWEKFVTEFAEKYKLDVRSSNRAAIRLETECEKLKKTMSANSNTIPLNIECFMEDRDVSSKVNREEFEGLIQPVLAEMEKTCTEFVEMMNKLEKPVTPDLVYAVEIVGGSSRVPAIKDLITKVFQKELSTTLNLDEAVARGCALQAAISSPTFRVRDFEVEEKTPYAIGIEYLTREGKPHNDTLFKAQSHAGMTKVISFARDADFELTAKYNTPADVPGAMDLIGNFQIQGVKPAYDGEAQKVKVKLALDAHGSFQVSGATLANKLEPVPEEETAEPSAEAVAATAKDDDVPMSSDSPAGEDDAAKKEGKKDEKKVEEKPKKKPKTHETVRLTVQSNKPGLLSAADLNLLIEKENEMQSNDRVEIETSQARNSLEEFIYEMRDQISYRFKDFIKEDLAEAYKAELQKAEDWLYEDGEEETKSVYVEKLAKLKTTSDPVVQRYNDAETRPGAAEKLRQRIVHYRKFLDQHAAGSEDYAHIPQENVDKVKASVEKTEAFINEKVAAQAALAKYDTPAFSTLDCTLKLDEMDRACKSISETPKPKVEAPPADKEATVEEGAAADAKAAPAEGEAAATAEGDMDLD